MEIPVDATMEIPVDATLSPGASAVIPSPAPEANALPSPVASGAPANGAIVPGADVEMEIPVDATLSPEDATPEAGAESLGVEVEGGASAGEGAQANAAEAGGLTRALMLAMIPQVENIPESVPELPAFALDYAREELVFSAPLDSGELRIYRPGELEPLYTVQAAALERLPLRSLDNAPQAEPMRFEMELCANGAVSARVALEIAARPAYAEGGEAQASAGYSTAAIAGPLEYALSAVDAASPEYFAADGHNFTRLMDGASYAVWARNPAADGAFASGWARLENVQIQTMVGIETAPSFSTDAIIPELRADWSAALAPFDAASGVHFFSEGKRVDAEVAGNFRFVWLNEAGEALSAPPVDAGSYRLQVETYGDAEKYVLRGGGALNYVISPVAAPQIAWPTAAELTYGQRLSESALTGGSAELGSFAWENGDVLPGAGESARAVIFTPADDRNYVWDAAQLRGEVKLHVRRRPASVYAGSFKKTVGTADPSFTASTEGVLSGDRLSYSLRRRAGEAPGKYAITVELGKNPNYDVRAVEGALTIERKSISADSVHVSAIPRQVYTGIEIEPKPVVRDDGVRLVEGTHYRLSYNGNRRVGVGTVTIEGIGDYGGSRDENFTIYQLSTSGGFVPSNNNEVEKEEGFSGHENFGEEGQPWDVSGFPFLYESERLGNALYDGYLGTGDGLHQLEAVYDGEGMPADYEAAILGAEADEEADAASYAASPAGTMLIYAGPDESGEPDARTLSLSGAQLARMYLDGGVGTLLFRNCDTTMMLDLYELMGDDVARVAGRMFAGELADGAAIGLSDLENMPEYALAAEDLYDLQYELRSVPVATQSGELGYDLSLWLIHGECEVEISRILSMLCVCANVEGLYEAGEEEAFASAWANALQDESGAVMALDGDLIPLPEEPAGDAADTADVYMVEAYATGEAPEMVTIEDSGMELYRSQNLVSPWAGPGAYILLERGSEA